MSESGLSINIFNLRREVAFYLGKGRDADNWTDDDVLTIDAHIASGLRMFYNPPNYSWSFLRPVSSVAVPSGTDEIPLPDDFGFICGDISADNGNSSWTLEQTSSTRIFNANKKLVSEPKYYAIVSKQMNANDGQRFSLLIYPKTIEAVTLTYQYNITPKTLDTETNTFPYGGMQHAETIREACLAAAESDSDDSLGVHQQKYLERLAASIAYDKNVSTPDRLGYNANGRRPLDRPIIIRINGTPVGADLPPVTESDNGEQLTVRNGQWGIGHQLEWETTQN